MPESSDIRGRCRTATALALPALIAAFVLSGCGGGSDDPREQDRVEIEAVVERINSAVSNGDAAAWCSVFSPESVTETFGSPARCRVETEKVIEGQESARLLEVKAIAFDGSDAARVAFTGAAGEANMSKVGGKWYLDLLQEADADPVPGGEPSGGASG